MSRAAKTIGVAGLNSGTNASGTIHPLDTNGVVMTKLYMATVVAVVVTTSMASNLLLVGTRSQLRLTLPVQLRLAARRRVRQLKHIVDAWVAGMIARRERQVAVAALHRLTDRELLDIGICRGGIRHAVRNSTPRLQAASIRVKR